MSAESRIGNLTNESIWETRKHYRNFKDFISLTEKYTSQNTEPGDYYKAVWCRDAAYILKDQFLSGSCSSGIRTAKENLEQANRK